MKSGAVFAVALALLALPASATAKHRISVERPQRWTEFSLPATNGYRVRVSATKAIPKALPNVFVTASRGQRDSVTYLAHGRSTNDGAIDAKLPGAGRISVRFHPTKVTRQAVAENCKGRSSITRHGVFRGTVELRGELGYTVLHAHSAKGKVTRSFRQVCDERESRANEGPSVGSFHERVLYAGTKEGSPTIDFSAYLTDFGLRHGGSIVSFTASSSKSRDGLFVVSSVTVQGNAAEFSSPDPAGSLDNATVEPPPPFQGSATFHLDSPTSSSWSGALSVELPGVGWVALAGPGFWSALCSERICTETLPSNVHITFF
jgi:hypothetical protein